MVIYDQLIDKLNNCDHITSGQIMALLRCVLRVASVSQSTCSLLMIDGGMEKK